MMIAMSWTKLASMNGVERVLLDRTRSLAMCFLGPNSLWCEKCKDHARPKWRHAAVFFHDINATWMDLVILVPAHGSHISRSGTKYMAMELIEKEKMGNGQQKVFMRPIASFLERKPHDVL